MNKIIEQRKPEQNAFDRAVDKVISGNKPIHYVKIGNTPDVLQMLGLPKAKVSIKGDTIEKVMGHYLGIEQGNHSNLHNITPETLKQLPHQLHEPIAVFKSDKNSTNPNSYVVLTQLWETDFHTQNNNPVIVAMRISANEQHIDITSVYGKDSRKSLQNWLDNNLIYWDKEKGQNLINTIGLQLPKALHESSDHSLDIKTNEDLSQYILEKNQNITNRLHIIAKDFSNDPASKEVQDRVMRLAQNQTQELIQSYKELDTTFNGRYIASDMMKEIFADFSQSPVHRNQFNNAVHNTAATLSAEHFKQMLDKPIQDGRDRVVFLTGCPGAGKTTSVMNDGKIHDDIHLIFEGQLANAHQNAATTDKIKQALENGYHVEIIAVNPLPEQALENTFKRFYDQNDGRGAPISTMARIQGNTYDGLKHLHEQFGDSIVLTVIDKPHGNENAIKYTGWEYLDVLKSQGTEQEIKQRLETHLLHHYQQGTIDYECFKQSTGSEEQARQLSSVDRPLFYNQSQQTGDRRELPPRSGVQSDRGNDVRAKTSLSSQAPIQIERDLINNRIYLYTSFKDNEAMQALKSQGIVKFDIKNKVWFAYEINKEAVTPWTTRPHVPSPEQAFAEYLQSKGITVTDGHPKFDGKTHRLANGGSKDKNVMYQAYSNPNGVPFARITNFSRDGIPENWQYPMEYLHILKNINAVEMAKGGASYSSEQIKPQTKQNIHEIPQETQQEKILQQNLMAERSKMVMSFAPIASNDHNYLIKKQVTANNVVRIVPDSSKIPEHLREHILIGNTPKQFNYLREHYPDQLVLQRGNLIIPQFNAHGELRAFETIAYNGSKYALQGAEKQGLSTTLGQLENGQPIILVEGYATGATLHEQTGRNVVVAFGRTGLMDIAQVLRTNFPDSKIYIGADNDHQKVAELKTNIGLEDAQKVANEVTNTYVLIPQFNHGDTGKDWNDIFVDKGVNVLKEQLKNQLNAINKPILAKQEKVETAVSMSHTKDQSNTTTISLDAQSLKENYPNMSDHNIQAIIAWRDYIHTKYANDPIKAEVALNRLTAKLDDFAKGEQLNPPKFEIQPELKPPNKQER